jgi:hypothetical protein
MIGDGSYRPVTEVALAYRSIGHGTGRAERRIRRVFPRVARGFKARASFMFVVVRD